MVMGINAILALIVMKRLISLHDTNVGFCLIFFSQNLKCLTSLLLFFMFFFSTLDYFFFLKQPNLTAKICQNQTKFQFIATVQRREMTTCDILKLSCLKPAHFFYIKHVFEGH